jgi:anti-sigma regulatory factor (Ser/Thr protein kinase)
MSDRIVLTIPRERPFHGIAHLVLGGLAARLNLTVESLEDLQLALDELLEQDEGGTDVTVEVRVGDGSIEAELGPFDAARLRAAMEPDQDSLGLQRLLATLVDGAELLERDGGQWIRIVKSLDAEAAA